MRHLHSRKSAQIQQLCFLVCLFCFCCFFSRQEAKAQYRFDSWTSESGLPQNSVNSILQTRDGYLWLTTFDGLVRYDGSRFAVFNKANSPGIKSNRFTTLFETENDSLWIGTEDAGVVRYREGVFETFLIADGAKSNLIWSFREDAELGLMAVTGESLVRWNGERFDRYGLNGAVEQRSKTLRQFAYSDESGLQVFDRGLFHTLAVTDSKIVSVTRDQYGVFWFLTDNGKVNRFKNGKVETFSLEKTPEVILRSAHQDRAGNLWLGWNNGHLSVRRNGEWKTYEPARSQIRHIYEDREGTIWLATEADGLFRIRQQAITVLAESEGLIGENVYPVLEDGDGAVWLGVWGGGLFRLRDGNLTRYTKRDGLGGTILTSLYQDRAGNLWAGGTRLYQFENNRFAVRLDEAVFNSTGIYAITEDRNGNLLLGTKVGLFKFKDGNLQRFATDEGLPHQTVQVIREDRAGNFWLGTLGGLGVLRSDGKIQSFTENDGLASNHVRSIYEDSDGVLWIGTYDGGISRFENNKFTNYTTANGLFTNGAFQILEDAQDNFWINSNLGIYRISRREMNEVAAGRKNSITSVSYGKADGLLSLEGNGGKQPAGVKTRDGRLWFPTQRGVAIINPSEISYNPLPPPVVIENCLLEREQTKCGQHLQISPGSENLEIHYTGLSFIKPEQVHFKYKLEGLDEEWVEAGTRRTAYYSYLPPGDYIFRVIAANSDGVWNEAGAQMRVRVLPPFWRTWWFLIFSFVGAAALVFWLYERRVSRLQKAHTAQANFSRQLIESQENERKRIAAELHDGLGQNLLVIKNRVLLALSEPAAPETAYTQLDEISGTVSQAIEEVRTIAHNLRPYQLDRLGLTLAIQAIIKKVAQSSAIRFESEIDSVDDLFSPEVEINFYRIVQESLNNIVKHSEAASATIKIKRDQRSVKLTISDDGKGFDFESNGNGKGGFGLTGIAERAAIINARYTLHSVPGEGTILTLMMDLPGKSDE